MQVANEPLRTGEAYMMEALRDIIDSGIPRSTATGLQESPVGSID